MRTDLTPVEWLDYLLKLVEDEKRDQEAGITNIRAAYKARAEDGIRQYIKASNAANQKP